MIQIRPHKSFQFLHPIIQFGNSFDISEHSRQNDPARPEFEDFFLHQLQRFASLLADIRRCHPAFN